MGTSSVSPRTSNRPGVRYVLTSVFRSKMTNHSAGKLAIIARPFDPRPRVTGFYQRR
jgi:hypothetical protein